MESKLHVCVCVCLGVRALAAELSRVPSRLSSLLSQLSLSLSGLSIARQQPAARAHANVSGSICVLNGAAAWHQLWASPSTRHAERQSLAQLAGRRPCAARVPKGEAGGGETTGRGGAEGKP